MRLKVNAVGDTHKIQSNSGLAGAKSSLYRFIPILYIFIVLVVAGSLAPLLHWAFSHWITVPFSRYVNRALMISALLALVPYLLKNWRTLGLNWKSGSRSELLAGLGISLGSVLVIVTFHLLSGARMFPAHPGKVVSLVFAALGAALIAAHLEEILFRGVIQKVLITRMGSTIGWLMAGLFFAIVHFIKVPRSFQPDPVTWRSGYESIALALTPLGRLETYSSQLFCLLAVGLILGMMYYRTDSLWMPIGLHAGWIVGLKLGSALTVPAPFAPAFSGGADLLSGGLTLILLSLLGLVLWKFAKPRKARHPT